MLFRDILVGWPGSVHDARVLRNSSLFATAAAKFPGDTHLLGDGGYPLKMLSLSSNSFALCVSNGDFVIMIQSSRFFIKIHT